MLLLSAGKLSLRSECRKEVPDTMMNVVVGAVLVIGIAIAIKEIRSKDKK